MIIDQFATFCPSGTSVAGSAGTTLLGSVIDTGSTGGLASTAPLDEDDLLLVIVTTTAIIGGAGATIRFQLASDAGPAIATNGSAVVLLQTADFAVGTAPIPTGTRLYTGGIPKSAGLLVPYKRFIGLLSVITGSVTAGAITAYLIPQAPDWVAMPVAPN